MEKIPFASPKIDLTRQDKIHINKILSGPNFCLGKWTDKLENYFKETYNVKYAIACCNATQGLIIALKAADICGNVALPAYTWGSTLYAIECNNCSPLFVDINKNTWLMEKVNPFVIENRTVMKHIDAVISVDIFGNRSYIESDVPVIIDAAHGFGIKDLGNRGLVEVVSFSFTKQITGGQGGMFLTNDSIIAEAAREYIKLSAKMMEVSAYLILKEIEGYDKKLEIKNRIINKYRDGIDIYFSEQIFNGGSNPSTYTIFLESKKERDRIKGLFEENGVETKIYYEPLIKGLPNSDHVFSRIIALPVYKQMENKIEFIIELINRR